MMKGKRNLIKKDPHKDTIPYNNRLMIFFLIMWKILNTYLKEEILLICMPQLIFGIRKKMPQENQRNI